MGCSFSDCLQSGETATPLAGQPTTNPASSSSTPTKPNLLRLQQSPSSRLFTFKNVDGSTPRADLGEFTDLAGNAWQGEKLFEESSFSGEGVYQRKGKKYQGHFLNSMPHGAGLAWDGKTKKYEGQFERGRRHGNGVMTYTDGKSPYLRTNLAR